MVNKFKDKTTFEINVNDTTNAYINDYTNAAINANTNAYKDINIYLQDFPFPGS